MDMRSRVPNLKMRKMHVDKSDKYARTIICLSVQKSPVLEAVLAFGNDVGACFKAMCAWSRGRFVRLSLSTPDLVAHGITVQAHEDIIASEVRDKRSAEALETHALPQDGERENLGVQTRLLMSLK